MTKNETKFIIAYKNLFLGIFGLILSYFLYETNVKLNTVTIIFILLLLISSLIFIWDYINPKNITIKKNSEQAKKIEIEESKKYFQSVNIESYNKSGFKTIIDGNDINVNWNEIHSIIIVFRDLFIVNETCLYLRIDNGKGFEISETSLFWEELNLNIINNLSGIDSNWLQKIKEETGEIINNIKFYERINVG